MALRGRIGGFVRASRYTRDQLTSAAREGFLARFARDVDPERIQSPTERSRRAEAALRAHMARLALRSAQSRRRTNASEKATPLTAATQTRASGPEKDPPQASSSSIEEPKPWTVDMNGKKERTSDRDGETPAGPQLNQRDLVYTPREAAVVLKVHVNTIYELCRRKELPHCYVGHQIRIAAAGLEVFVQGIPAPPPSQSVGTRFRRE